MNPIIATTALCIALIGSPVGLCRATEPYALGPGDHVQVKVSDFRSGTGEAYQWTMFSQNAADDFVVGPDGHLSLPVVGQIEAAGKTTGEVGEAVALVLQGKAGLTARPDASVQIVKFRPFYIVGGVDKPGEYEYRPGLTVLQALSIAGGLERVASDALIGLEKDALNARGDLRVLESDRISLIARQARLDAEIAEKPQIEFPAEWRDRSENPDVARATREEQLLLDAHRTGLEKQITSLEGNKALLHHEIDRLREKDATIAKQLTAMNGEHELIAGLVAKGLSPAPRALELEQNIAQIEGNQLDVQVAMVRANEEIAKSDREIYDLRTKSRNDMLVEAQDVRVKLAETIEKIQTSRSLVQHAEVRAPGMISDNANAYVKPIYVIFRRDPDGKSQSANARESDPVRPGDVVRVIPTFSQTTPSAANSN